MSATGARGEAVPLVAFLRGINLGRRQVKMADLRDAFSTAGFGDAETLIASGNVLFGAVPDEGLAARIEAALEARFGFAIGVVLRSLADLGTMAARAPFAGVPEGADVKRYVTFVAGIDARSLPRPPDVPGDFAICEVTEGEIFAIGYRTESGRYGPGLDALPKPPREATLTMRNWNTVLRMIEKAGA